MKNDTINLLEPTIQECGGNYESAMSYDCVGCKRECEFRKGGNPIAVAFFILAIVFMGIIIWQIVKYL